METGVSETVTRFIVVERLVLRAFVPAGLGEVVPVWFAVGYRERDERVVASLLEVNACPGTACPDNRSGWDGAGNWPWHTYYNPVCHPCYGNIRSPVREGCSIVSPT